ncbi:MAG TPA: hypothetical protein EYQ64_05330 [Gemmatimonadetes bacterium]|nr:hypothetical protein [Gemmatimonadota bacterium]
MRLRRTPSSIFRFWVPLAAQWLMMASEGPFLAALIARMVDPEFNLAAYGVAFAFAILIESPVIMLMSASTALVEDSATYRKLRNFMYGLNALSTGLLLTILFPPVYGWLMGAILGLPEQVADLTYGALWLLLPWPLAIGYRRFLQGILIRSGRTRLVAYGTVLRLAAMAVTGLVLYRQFALPGAWAGAAALSAGVGVEAIAAHFMAASTVRELNRQETKSRAGRAPLGYWGIARFYYPLALTSLIGLTVQPMLTFFMGRSLSPIESLAVFPVVHALSFLFRSFGLSFQEAALALIGDDHEHFPEIARFGLWLGLATSAGMGLVAFTPLASVWFSTVSGLTLELTAFALVPARILVPIPALSVLLALERAILIQARKTHPITMATSIEVASIAILFVSLGWGLDFVGVTSAFLAFLGGRCASVLYLGGVAAETIRNSK